MLFIHLLIVEEWRAIRYFDQFFQYFSRTFFHFFQSERVKKRSRKGLEKSRKCREKVDKSSTKGRQKVDKRLTKGRKNIYKSQEKSF